MSPPLALDDESPAFGFATGSRVLAPPHSAKPLGTQPAPPRAAGPNKRYNNTHSQQLPMARAEVWTPLERHRSEPCRSRQREYTPPLSPSPLYILTSYVLGAGQRGEAACAAWGRLVLRSPNPLLSLRMITAAAPRHSSAHSHTYSHMLIGTCQAAQPLFGCCAARLPVSSPPPHSRRASLVRQCCTPGCK